MEGLLVPKGKGAGATSGCGSGSRRSCARVLAPGIRTAVVAIPRGNGKSTLAAALALWALVDGPEGAEVPIVAGVSERQAFIAFNTARRMVQLDSELADRMQVFQDKLYMPHHDATLYPLPADADALLGANPTMTIVDELGVVDVDVFEAMRLAVREAGRVDAAGDRDAAVGPREHHAHARRARPGRRRPDVRPHRVRRRPGRLRVDDREAWKVADPRSATSSTRMAWRPRRAPSGSRRSGSSVSGSGRLDRRAQWMAPELWASRATRGPVPDGAAVVLALDGSFSQDCTALVACTVGETPHLDVVGLWENPNASDESYRVDVLDVEDTIREACRRWRVARSHRRPVPVAAQPRRSSPTSASPSPSTRRSRRA